MRNWQLQEAKARFSELVKCASIDGPQNITVHGKSMAIVISREEYDKMTKPKISFIQLLRKSPLLGLNLKLSRDKSPNRDIDL